MLRPGLEHQGTSHLEITPVLNSRQVYLLRTYLRRRIGGGGAKTCTGQVHVISKVPYLDDDRPSPSLTASHFYYSSLSSSRCSIEVPHQPLTRLFLAIGFLGSNLTSTFAPVCRSSTKTYRLLFEKPPSHNVLLNQRKRVRATVDFRQYPKRRGFKT